VRTIAVAMTLAVAAFFAACSSSSGGGGTDAAVVDVVAMGPEIDSTVAADAGEEEAEISPVYTCDQAQLSFATTMACGQCVAQKCAKYLQSCTNCILCQQQLGSACAACGAACSAGPGPGPGPIMTVDAGP
jgi:hypothetical protein